MKKVRYLQGGGAKGGSGEGRGGGGGGWATMTYHEIVNKLWNETEKVCRAVSAKNLEPIYAGTQLLNAAKPEL